MKQEITRELSDFINENKVLTFSESLVNAGFINSRNVISTHIINDPNGAIIFSEENIVNFCKKYNLFYDIAQNYTGTIPSKNVKKLESYQCHDKVYQYTLDHGFYETVMFHSNHLLEKSRKGFFSSKRYWKGDLYASHVKELKSTFIIIAPIHDFKEKMDSETRTAESLDPAIFEKFFDVTKNCFMYQLVTCWGSEAGAIEFQKPHSN